MKLALLCEYLYRSPDVGCATHFARANGMVYQGSGWTVDKAPQNIFPFSAV